MHTAGSVSFFKIYMPFCLCRLGSEKLSGHSCPASFRADFEVVQGSRGISDFLLGASINLAGCASAKWRIDKIGRSHFRHGRTDPGTSGIHLPVKAIRPRRWKNPNGVAATENYASRADASEACSLSAGL
jgi:hypothetical protein